MQKPPPVSRRGPVGSVRSLRLALRPRSSRLPPGATNKAQEPKKGEENGPQGYGSGVGLELELVERHVHVAAIARHDDGDGAAILAVEQAHGARWLLRGSALVRRVDGSVAGIGVASTDRTRICVNGLRTVRAKGTATLSPSPPLTPASLRTAPSSLVVDAHLAALAIEHGATLASTDRDFTRFPGLRFRDPLV